MSEQFSIEGETRSGLSWHWSAPEPLGATILYLYPDVGVPTKDDRWRHEQSIRVGLIFDEIQFPGVQRRWVEPIPLEKHRPVGLYPEWSTTLGPMQFLYGIVGELWDRMTFDPNPPNSLLAEWVQLYVDDEREEVTEADHANHLRRVMRAGRLSSHLDLCLEDPAKPGRTLVPLLRELQELLRKHPERRVFQGGDRPPLPILNADER